MQAMRARLAGLGGRGEEMVTGAGPARVRPIRRPVLRGPAAAAAGSIVVYTLGDCALMCDSDEDEEKVEGGGGGRRKGSLKLMPLACAERHKREGLGEVCVRCAASQVDARVQQNLEPTCALCNRALTHR